MNLTNAINVSLDTQSKELKGRECSSLVTMGVGWQKLAEIAKPCT